MNLIIFLYQHILKFRVAIVLAYYMSTVVDTFEKNNPIYREVLLLAAEICVDFSIPTIPGINLFYFNPPLSTTETHTPKSGVSSHRHQKPLAKKALYQHQPTNTQPRENPRPPQKLPT